LLQDVAIHGRYDAYVGEFRAYERIRDATYQHQVAIIDGNRTIGKQDAFRLFMERNAQLLAEDGVTGVVVPSAFHANEGATGVRKLYLEEMGLEHCYSFENRRQLFEIHRSFKFALVIARRRGPTDQFDCAFYLHDDEWLFGDRSAGGLRYGLRFVQQTGGEYLSLLELRSKSDYEIAQICYDNGCPLGKVCETLGIRLGRELNTSDDAWRLTATGEVLRNREDPRDPDIAAYLLGRGYLAIHEGKSFWHYDDHWEQRPRSLIHLSLLGERSQWMESPKYHRLALRKIASSTNERTLVMSFLPTSWLSVDSVHAELAPQARKSAAALCVVAESSSFITDWLTRMLVGANVNLFIVNRVPLVDSLFNSRLLVHNALRLTCNHAGYALLWREQLGDTWREATPPYTWPVLAGDDARWAVRAAIDAVVAQAYGLDRAQYAHVLSTFSHKSYPQAPALCLARFDELAEIGLEAFTKKWDPYWDVPLNEALPEAVIELPVVASVGDEQQLRLEL
jgi:hypothetical protein